MSTETNPPAHPAKGNLRGQTTLAAKIDRWEIMSDNVQADLAALPQLKDFQVEFSTDHRRGQGASHPDEEPQGGRPPRDDRAQ
jgi:hypothetical protein